MATGFHVIRVVDPIFLFFQQLHKIGKTSRSERIPHAGWFGLLKIVIFSFQT